MSYRAKHAVICYLIYPQKEVDFLVCGVIAHDVSTTNSARSFDITRKRLLFHPEPKKTRPIGSEGSKSVDVITKRRIPFLSIVFFIFCVGWELCKNKAKIFGFQPTVFFLEQWTFPFWRRSGHLWCQSEC